MTTPRPEQVKLSEAIVAILELAPALIEREQTKLEGITGETFGERQSREWHSERIDSLRGLLASACRAACDFQVRSASGKKRRPGWRLICDAAAALIGAALLNARGEIPSFNDGPALIVLRRAMAHVEGKERAITALREAFRQKY
jgi:hypothetical protein